MRLSDTVKRDWTNIMREALWFSDEDETVANRILDDLKNKESIYSAPGSFEATLKIVKEAKMRHFDVTEQANYITEELVKNCSSTIFG